MVVGKGMGKGMGKGLGVGEGASWLYKVPTSCVTHIKCICT